MDEPIQEASGHTPVLLKEIAELLVPALETVSAPVVVDATVGLGGHARVFLDRMDHGGRLVALDADPDAIERARAPLAEGPARVDLVHANFRELPEVLAALGIRHVHVILADLGVSSMQLAAAGRGFSFRGDGPLDMRMDPRLKTTAADLVNRLKEKELGDLLYYNAQEYAGRKIARRICENRREGRITTTGRLALVVSRAVGVEDPTSRKSKIHPATRTFLALRMAVNEEIANLKSLLAAAPSLLAPGGRIGVISFHSVEDKEVKTDFRARKSEGLYELVNKKPIIASMDERIANPRSRSAKLRVAVRLCEPGDALD